MVELLAPAGDAESLKAAVLNGANAVYLGGKEFSARQSAGNFDRNEMIEAVRYCHSYNVKVYVTLNTLLDNKELKGAVEYAAYLYEIGVDALIIQDIGLLKLLRENIPEFELHGSTQMTAHNIDTVNMLYNMGVKRVVLARELSLDEIEYIVKNTKAEIEVFVHGALCISFSGQCLFSSIIGGRSGNRGRCAQPCRMEYIIDGGSKAHYLSPKDICSLDFIDKIKSIGVNSLKIEGRMKRPEYVATVVSAYKIALENKYDEKHMEDVTQIFNRGGNSSGYFYGKQGKDLMSYERPKNWGTYLGDVVKVKGKFAEILLQRELNVGDGIEVFGKNKGAPVGNIKVKDRDVKTAKKGEIAFVYIEGASKGDKIYKSLDSKLIDRAKESYLGDSIYKMPLKAKFKAFKNENINLHLENNYGVFVEVIGDIPEIALKTPTSKERVNDNIKKTGDTPFYISDIQVQMDDDIVIPVSKINSLRREAIEKLIDTLQRKRNEVNINVSFNKSDKNNAPSLVVTTGREEIAKASIDAGCDILFFGGDTLRTNKGDIKNIIKYSNGRTKVYPWYPSIMLENYEEFKKQALLLRDNGIDRALCGNMGFYNFLKEIGYDVFIDYNFNIFNSPACDIFENCGCMLSPELNIKQIKDTVSKCSSRTMLQIHGKTKLMTIRNCIVGSYMGHGKEGCPDLCKNKAHNLSDKYGEEYKVLTDWQCKSHIYSSKILCTLQNLKDIISLKVDYLTIGFIDETPGEAEDIIRAYREGIKNEIYGEGGLSNNSKNILKEIKKGISTGHLYKGVL